MGKATEVIAHLLREVKKLTKNQVAKNPEKLGKRGLLAPPQRVPIPVSCPPSCLRNSQNCHYLLVSHALETPVKLQFDMRSAACLLLFSAPHVAAFVARRPLGTSHKIQRAPRPISMGAGEFHLFHDEKCRHLTADQLPAPHNRAIELLQYFVSGGQIGAIRKMSFYGPKRVQRWLYRPSWEESGSCWLWCARIEPRSEHARFRM